MTEYLPFYDRRAPPRPKQPRRRVGKCKDCGVGPFEPHEPDCIESRAVFIG